MPTDDAIFRATFMNIEHFCSEVRQWDLDFEPLGKTGGSKIVAELTQRKFGNIEFGSARFDVAIDQTGSPPANQHTFTILGSQMKSLFWRGQFVTPSDILVFREGAELKSVSGSDFENFCLSFSEDYVEQIAEREQVFFAPIHRRPEIFQPPQQLLELARSLLIICRDSDTNVSNAELGDLTDQLILSWLSNSGLKRKKSVNWKREQVLRKCIEHIYTYPFEQVSVGALSVASGASRRTLEGLFKEQFDLGPAEFMKRLRIAHVRRELVEYGPNDMKVSDVTEKFGFNHIGQFAKDYAVLFGELPSETLHRNVRRCLTSAPMGPNSGI